MTAKFNQELYAKIKQKKNEPLSSVGQRRLRVVEKEKDKEVAEKGSSTPALDKGRATSLGVSIKEVTPLGKKHKTGGKGRRKWEPVSGQTLGWLWLRLTSLLCSRS
ncbi:hypothetical protein SO802_003635 [Lithocarpus litseifolius]|uniref:Uncharacterized protein n=1 Tax=Lithocarpus litseifolius TaxID=425828 RepID=A0AAW2E6C2_9ROSI